MRYYCLLLLVVLFAGCKPGRKVSTSFYYWKTVYRQTPIENNYLHHLHVNKLYTRIMDVDISENSNTATPVSPIVFADKFADTIQIVPVVFIVNDVLKNLSRQQLDGLAGKVINFVEAKTQQAGKANYNEIQIDCDWTAQTRENYFYMLRQIKHALHYKTLSVTLRLHQIKNEKSTGVPPADKVLLMCYNMGNLRKYGVQNSIIDVSELKKYIGDNLTHYPMHIDIGLPLFSWAVVFRNKQYVGIDKRINFDILNDRKSFETSGVNLYIAKTDLSLLGLHKADVVRWETSSLADIQAVTSYIAGFIKADALTVIYFHLDEQIIKNYKYEELQNTCNLLH